MISLWMEEVKKDFGLKLDKWQWEVMRHHGNSILRTGRQVGKSTITALKVTDFAIMNEKTTSLVIAASQRQASLLFEKIRAEFDNIEGQKLAKIRKSELYKGLKTKKQEKEYEKGCSIYNEPPTKTKIDLNNGSKIYCLPAGKTGVFIRGYTIDLLIADEAAYIPEAVWTSIKPMLAVSRKRSSMGWIILLSTPFGKGGYFYECWTDDDFRRWHISSEKCSRIDKAFLRKEQKKLTKQEYAQEYKGEFIDEFRQLFPTKIIKKCMDFMKWENTIYAKMQSKFYLGIDVARFGMAENGFVESQLLNDGVVVIPRCFTTERKAITDTAGFAQKLDEKKHYRKFFTDDTGVGGGVTDILIEKCGKTRVFGINNAGTEFRGVDGAEKRRKINKEDLYSNALRLMEQGKIHIVNNLKLLRSLKGVNFTYTSTKNLLIHGKEDHLAEAFVRACWCVKAKGLRLFIA